MRTELNHELTDTFKSDVACFFLFFFYFYMLTVDFILTP